MGKIIITGIDGALVMSRPSNLTGRISTRFLNITWAQWDAFIAGEFVQNAFPHLTPEDREFILTGITEQEWAMVFDRKYPDLDTHGDPRREIKLVGLLTDDELFDGSSCVRARRTDYKEPQPVGRIPELEPERR